MDLQWCEDYRNVLRLARWLLAEQRLCTAQEMYDYFEKPVKWTDEWNELEALTKAPV